MTQGEEQRIRGIPCDRSGRTTRPAVAAVAVEANAAIAAGATDGACGRTRASRSTRSTTRCDSDLRSASRGNRAAAWPGEAGSATFAPSSTNCTVAAAATGTATTSLPTLTAAGARLTDIRSGSGVSADAAHRQGTAAIAAIAAIAERLCGTDKEGRDQPCPTVATATALASTCSGATARDRIATRGEGRSRTPVAGGEVTGREHAGSRPAIATVARRHARRAAGAAITTVTAIAGEASNRPCRAYSSTGLPAGCPRFPGG
jgi:hypothetical protein